MLRDSLSVGNLNDKGDSGEILEELRRDPKRINELMLCLEDELPLVRARAVAILESLVRTKPELAQLAERQLPKIADGGELWLTRMNVCRLIPKIRWRKDDYETMLGFLFDQAESAGPFVAAWALDSLAQMAHADDSLRPRVIYMLEEARETGSPAVRARARKALLSLRTSS